LSSRDEALNGKPFLVTVNPGTPTWKTLDSNLKQLGVSAPDPDLPNELIYKPIDTDSRNDDDDPRSTVRIGAGEGGKDVILDLNKNPSVIVSGGTGSGKTVLMRTIIEHGLRHDGIRLNVIDLNGVQKNLRQGDRVARSIDEAYDLITRLRVEMNDTYKQLANTVGDAEGEEKILSSRKTEWIIIDPADWLLGGVSTLSPSRMGTVHAAEKISLMTDTINYLVRLCRSAGIYVFMITGYLDTISTSGREIVSNSMTKIYCGHQNWKAFRDLFSENPRYDLPARPRGRAVILNMGGRQQIFQIGFIPTMV
jgi:hypothetical protein